MKISKGENIDEYEREKLGKAIGGLERAAQHLRAYLTLSDEMTSKGISNLGVSFTRSVAEGGRAPNSFIEDIYRIEKLARDLSYATQEEAQRNGIPEEEIMEVCARASVRDAIAELLGENALSFANKSDEEKKVVLDELEKAKKTA